MFDPSIFDDEQEDYPEWGPVFLSAASKAMLLNWYRKAQRLRAGKKGKRRKAQRFEPTASATVLQPPDVG